MTQDTQKLKDIETLAQLHIEAAGLAGWRFRWMPKATRTFGLCRYLQRDIGISLPLALANTEARVEETIIHEVAHAVAGHAAGHGYIWRKTAKALGLANPQRCWDVDENTNAVKRTKGWALECPKCGTVHEQTRLKSEFQTGHRHYICRTCRVKVIPYRIEQGRPANWEEYAAQMVAPKERTVTVVDFRTGQTTATHKVTF